MKFSVYTNDIREALKPVVKCAAAKPMTPILAGVKIVAEGGDVSLAATDFNVAALTKIPANVEVEGEVCVSAKYLFSAINKITDDVTTFFATENSLEVSSGGSKFTLLVFDPKDFPRIEFPQGDVLKVRATLFKDVARKTLFAVSKEEDRPIFKGVNIQTKFVPGNGAILQAYATNTHRMAAYLGGMIPSDSAPEMNVIVPAQALRNIAAELGDDDENYISIVHDGNRLSFHFDNIFYKTRLIDGEFPPIDRVLDVPEDNTAVFYTKEMKAAIDAANIIAKESEYKSVHLRLHENCIEVAADSNDCGKFSATIEAQCSKELEIAFNVSYLLDFLSVINCTRTCLCFTDHYNPVLMRDFGDAQGNYVYVVTPVRT